MSEVGTVSGSVRSTVDATAVVVVSRNRLFRDCLTEQLEEADGFRVSGEAKDLRRGIAEARQSDASLLLVDGSCLDEEGFALVGALADGPRVVVLGVRDLVEDLRRCVEAGISGIAYRDTPLDELVRTLALVMRGERVCSATPTRDLFSRMALLARRKRQHQRLGVLRLTARQMEVLRLVARGHGNESIAGRLGLSAHTVKNHVHNILYRLDARDRAEAVAHAYQRRWLP